MINGAFIDLADCERSDSIQAELLREAKALIRTQDTTIAQQRTTINTHKALVKVVNDLQATTELRLNLLQEAFNRQNRQIKKGNIITGLTTAGGVTIMIGLAIPLIIHALK